MSVDISLYKLNKNHITNLFYDIRHSLPSKTTCKKTALQLSADELQWIRNAVHDTQIFVVVDESALSGTQYSKILVRNLEISRQ